MRDNGSASDIIGKLVKSSLGIPLLILVMLATTVLPIPAFGLDVLFSFNITLSLIVLLTVVYVSRPLEFSVFPTVLLVSTLLRLTLNIASTRIVLLNGHQGPDAAGQVIHAFGEVVIGGNFMVGIVVFAILVIINFVVVTKGATRISEVTARFTLDAMPGKQMAIDADLNAGVITQDEAKVRRSEIVQEADFYGAMDGASKFVRGDSVAGILILFINLIGGVAIGVANHGMPFTSALQTFALLTIGDGLVAQIPSLLLSTASAVMVTRVNSSHDFGKQVLDQIFFTPRPLAVAGVILGILAIIPGMPHIAFALLAAASGGAAYYIKIKKEQPEQIEEAEPQTDQKTEPQEEKELDWDDVRPVDVIGLEIGYRLITLVGTNQEGVLMTRIKGIRKKLTQELGFLIPPVHIRDNLQLAPHQYRITLMGVLCAEADIQIDNHLAINPGHIQQKIDGIPTKDPTFGLDAVWIKSSKKEYAQGLGYTVVDPSTVIATHLSHIIKTQAADILGHEEGQQLLDRLAESAPKLVESLTGPGGLPLSVIVQVLKQLLRSDIPIIDIRTIAGKLVEAGTKSQDPDVLTEAVRASLKRLIVHRINGNKDQLSVGVFNGELEQLLHQSIQKANDQASFGLLGLEPGLAENIYKQLTEFGQRFEVQGKPGVLLVAPELRPLLDKVFAANVPNLHILSHQEVPDDKQINVEATIG